MRRLPALLVPALALAFACRNDRLGPNDFAHPNVNANAPFLIGAGDIADCNGGNAALTANLLDTLDGTVFTLGDNAYPNGSPADYSTCYDPSWGRHKFRTRPAVGDEDYNTAGAMGYFSYFGGAAGDTGAGYYSYDIDKWHVVVLNSYVDIGDSSAQMQWLRGDLNASRALCTVAYWHAPLFASGSRAGGRPSLQPLWQTLYNAGVDVVINGQEHNYERFAPQTPTGAADPTYGIREFVVGTGGAPFNGFNAPVANSQARDASTYGVLQLALNADGYGWRFVPSGEQGGTFTDAGTAQCHGPPPNSTPPPVANAGGPYLSTNGTVHFAGSATVAADNQQPLTFVWDFGDGNSNASQNPTHTYAAAGGYTVSLIVIDNKGARSDPVSTTVTVAAISPVYTFSGAANIANCHNDNDEKTAEILDTLPGYVFTIGDNVFDQGSPLQFLNCYHPTWGRHRSRTFATLGNIDYASGTADGAFDYFGSRVGPRGLGYYSFDLGAWHVIVLNDNIDFSKGSTQEQWLLNDLAANNRLCTMALFHVPLFLSSSTPGYTSNPSRKVLWDDLYAAGVDVVLNGNQHQYERMAPMRPDGTVDSASGIVQFDVGTGGDSKGMPTVIHPNSQALFAAFGVISFTLQPGGYAWTFLPIPGSTGADSGSGTCH